ncbi:MAG TPA: TerC/Alx family metal homeostasis membrane protein [Gaiellaceae bacterium]
MDVAWWAWAALSGGVLFVLWLDLFLFHREDRTVGLKEAGFWTVVWFVLAVAFGGVLWAWLGPDEATRYLVGYVVERSLSIDNIFVLVVLFAYFAVPPTARHRALIWGVVGALVLRVVFILLGAVALERVAWTAYLLGAFLILTGLRLAVREVDVKPERNPVLRLMRRFLPMTAEYEGTRFLVRSRGRRVATPMVAVIAAVATTDLAFAMDSIPAVFAVTEEPFLVFAVNAFAMLGLVALYFLLAATVDRFRYLRPALAAILVFVGLKMALRDVFEIPVGASLALVVAAIALAAAASALRPLPGGETR